VARKFGSRALIHRERHVQEKEAPKGKGMKVYELHEICRQEQQKRWQMPQGQRKLQ